MKASLKLVTAVAAGLLWAGLGTAQDLNPGGESKPQQQAPAAPQSSSPSKEPASQEPASPEKATTPPAQTDQPKSQPAKIPTAAPEPCATCGDAASAKGTARKRRRRRTRAKVAVGLQSNKVGVSTETSNGALSGNSNGTSAALPDKIVVRNGGAKDNTAQLSPGGGRDPNSHSGEAIAQLLATTDVNLKKLASRQLTPTQQITIDQIHSYVVQAKSAADAGDLIRAHTLAYKARLLSDDLSK